MTKISKTDKIQINAPHPQANGSYSVLAKRLAMTFLKYKYSNIVVSSISGGVVPELFNASVSDCSANDENFVRQRFVVYPQRQVGTIPVPLGSANSMVFNVELPSLMILIVNPRMVSSDIYQNRNSIMWAVAETQKMLKSDIDVMKNASAIWCMSKYVYEITKDAMPENNNIFYMPCIISDAYRPMNTQVCRDFMANVVQKASIFSDPTVRQGTREWANHHITYDDLKNAFIFGTVGANVSDPSRKDFYALVTVFSKVLSKVPNAYLYLHTSSLYGEDWVRHAIGLGVADRILCPKMELYDLNMFDDRYLAMIMNAWDVTVTAEWGAGFGLPYVEAQACGVPFIGLEHSSLTEHTHPSMLVKCKPEYLAPAPKHEGILWWSRWDLNAIAKSWVAYYLQPQSYKEKMKQWSTEYATQYYPDNFYKNHLEPFFDNFEFPHPRMPAYDIWDYLENWWKKANPTIDIHGMVW